MVWAEEIPGERRFYSEDPWGNRIEFLAERERPAGFAGTHLGRLRAKVGTDLILSPGAMLVVQREDGGVLLTRRGDNGTWCNPAGAAEEGGSFASTAVAETAEEAGVTVAPEDLVAFGSLSEADLHTVHYPSGDLVHCFALLFLARRWTGEPRADGAETTAIAWAQPEDLPEPMHGPSRVALELLAAWRESGKFQIR